jgi:Ras-related protein Rab-8A
MSSEKMIKKAKSLKPEFDVYIRLLMLGDSGVGKSSLLIRFSDNKFESSLMGTAGVDFKTKYITIGNSKVKLEVWDTAGQERFSSMTTKYYNGSMGIVLVYDVSDRNSYDNIHRWVEQIKLHTNEEEICIVLIGNKTDLEASRVVSTEEGNWLAAKFNIPFAEASAKNDTNVEASFLKLASNIFERKKILLKSEINQNKLNGKNVNGSSAEQNNAQGKSKNIKLAPGKENKEKKCC